MSEALSPQTDAVPSVGNKTSERPSQGHGDPAATTADQDLVAASIAGDDSAFEQLVQIHGPRLYQLVLRMAGDAELANDLFQDVLFHAWQRLDQFSGKSALSTWLWSVGRNRALDQLRKRRPQTIDPQHLVAEAPSDGNDPLQQTEQQHLLHRALASLSDDAREIIILRDFQDEDYAHIAETLDIPEGTVKSRLSRARAQLRSALSPYIRAEDLS